MLELDICRELKDAGFNQSAELHYARWSDSPGDIFISLSDEIGISLENDCIGGSESVKQSVCACPSSDEIWEKLNSDQRSDFSFNLCSNHSYEWNRDMFFSIETALAKYWLELQNKENEDEQ